MQNLPYRLACAASALLLTGAAGHALAESATRISASIPLAVGATGGPVASPAAAAPDAFDSANLFLFSVQLDGVTLTDGLAGYGSADDPLIPVGELTRLLEADVDVSVPEGKITGRLGGAGRSLLIDLRSHTAQLAGRHMVLAPDDAVVGPSDIYIRLSTLQTLLPIRATADGAMLAIEIHALEPFPVQTRLQRLANRPDGRPSGGGQNSLVVETPYQLFTPPGVDVLLEGGARSTPPHLPRRFDLRIAGDIFYSNLQAYAASDDTGALSTARAMLQRRSIEGGMFGPLHAREFDLGDVFTPALPLGAASVGGRGLYFSTAPLEQANVFNRIDLRGELPAGYDAELYVNEMLKASTSQSSNGLYEFRDVALSPGVNVVRVATYGPRGERRQTVRVINIGAGLLHRGDTTFQLGAVQQNESLFDFRPSAISIDSPATQATRGGARIIGQANYGLTELITLTGGAALIPAPIRGERDVYALGLRTSILGLATAIDAAHDSQGGEAASAGLAGGYHGVQAVLRHAEYRGGFIDENALGAGVGRLERRSELTVDTALQLRGRIIPFSLRLLQNAYEDGTNDLFAGGRMSVSTAGVLLSTGLDYARQGRTAPRLTGYLATSTFRSYAWQLRANLDYQLKPDVRATLLTLALDHPISPSWSMHLGVSEPLDDPSGVDVSLSAVNTTRFGDLSLIGEYDNGLRAWRVATQLSFGLGYDPDRGRYQLGRIGPGSGGSLLLDAFLDANGDGVRQPGEAPVSNVKLDTGGASAAETGKDGRLLLSGMGPGPTSSVRVDIQGIDDPSVSSPPESVQFTTRPGSTTRISYPLRPTGDVAVRVELLRDDGQTVGLSAARVLLVPAGGGAPLEGVTEFDGTSMFSQTPAGVYKVELDSDQAAKLRMHMIGEVSVTIKSDGSFTNDAVVQVRFDPALDAPPSQLATR